tara:strand:+ start:5261 stop:5458 length:198 start_codon:yes stop_codon:yes gene_type:complete
VKDSEINKAQRGIFAALSGLASMYTEVSPPTPEDDPIVCPFCGDTALASGQYGYFPACDKYWEIK